MKVRYCKEGCGQVCAPRVQYCPEHHLARRPFLERMEAREERLSKVPEDQRRARVPESEWPAGRRWCAGCQTFVLLDLCRGSRCRDCASAAGHATRLKSEYGIDTERYDELFALQGGRCAICRGVPRSKRLAVDHDHNTGQVRGLICGPCNHVVLTAVRHSQWVALNVYTYLATPPADGAWLKPQNERDADAYRS